MFVDAGHGPVVLDLVVKTIKDALVGLWLAEVPAGAGVAHCGLIRAGGAGTIAGGIIGRFAVVEVTGGGGCQAATVGQMLLDGEIEVGHDEGREHFLGVGRAFSAAVEGSRNAS